METLLYFSWPCLELLAFHLIDSSFLRRRGGRMRPFCAYPAAMLLMLAGQWLGLPDWGGILLNFGLFTALSFLLYQGKWAWRLLTVTLSGLLPFVCYEVVLWGTCRYFSLRLAELLQRHLTWLVVVTTGKLLAVLIAWLIHRLRAPNPMPSFRWKWLLLTLLFPAVSFVMLAVIFFSCLGRNDLSDNAFFFCCALAFANVAIVFLLQTTENSAKRNQELALLNQQLEIQTQSIQSLEKSYRAQRQATHDYQSQLQTIQQLLSGGQYTTALSYVQQLQGVQSTRIFTVNSHHPIADAVLNQKYQLASENGIEMQMQVNDLSAVNLQMNELVVLLSNLLDNAIEACLRLPEGRCIQCSFLLEEGLFLSIRNTSPPVTVEENRLPTTKDNPGEHGFGLATVIFILERRRAEYTLDYEDGWFQFVAEIPDCAGPSVEEPQGGTEE